MGVIFCQVCGKGINLIKGETPYKCPLCDRIVCAGCYNQSLPDCGSCAPQLIIRLQEEEARLAEQVRLATEAAAREEAAKQRESLIAGHVARLRAVILWADDAVQCPKCGEYFIYPPVTTRVPRARLSPFRGISPDKPVYLWSAQRDKWYYPGDKLFRNDPALSKHFSWCTKCCRWVHTGCCYQTLAGGVTIYGCRTCSSVIQRVEGEPGNRQRQGCPHWQYELVRRDIRDEVSRRLLGEFQSSRLKLAQLVLSLGFVRRMHPPTFYP